MRSGVEDPYAYKDIEDPGKAVLVLMYFGGNGIGRLRVGLGS